MSAPWNFILRKRPSAADPVGGGSEPEAETPVLLRVGERNELLHVRFSYMADRLEDLKSLSDDFHQLSKPLEELSTELPKAKARVLELEALLRRESEERTHFQRELAQSAEKLATLTSDHHALYNRSKEIEEDLDQLHITSDGDRSRLAETQKLLANADQQLTAERENRQRLEADVVGLTALLSERTDEIQKSQDVVAQQADRNAAMEREMERLQGAVDKQVFYRVDLQSRLNESERLAQDRLRILSDLQQKLDTEQAARQQREHTNELTLAGLNAEKASLVMQLEASTARAASAEQTINQTRVLLSEKDNAARTADARVRQLERQVDALERQSASLEQRLNAKSAELADSQHSADALSKRSDMLTKALSAKEAALAQALEKAQGRSERVEDLTKEFELERAASELSRRRLIEELENERAERALAQGALNIARESRASLQRLNESLKRANRSFRPLPPEEATASEPQSNVSFLPVGQKPSADDE
jgi:crescentin